MTSFFDITVGQMQRFHGALERAGFTPQIIRRIAKDPVLADRMFDALEIGPEWYVTPERQLNRAQVFWPSITDWPPVPTGMAAPTETAVLMLCVYDTIHNLWTRVHRTDEYEPVLGIGVDDATWESFSDVDSQKKVTWGWFDPENTENELNSGADSVSTAGPEGLMALIMFPDWPLLWGSQQTPVLAGYSPRDTMCDDYLALSLTEGDEGRRKLSLYRATIDIDEGYPLPTFMPLD